VVSHSWKKKRLFLPYWRSLNILSFPQWEGRHSVDCLLHGAEHDYRTCFFVLGLISSTSQGAEILDDYRWEATLSPLGLPTGLCIPSDLDKFISVRHWISLTGCIWCFSVTYLESCRGKRGLRFSTFTPDIPHGAWGDHCNREPKQHCNCKCRITITCQVNYIRSLPTISQQSSQDEISARIPISVLVAFCVFPCSAHRVDAAVPFTSEEIHPRSLHYRVRRW
jgi:hypothetical protein